MLHQLTKHLVPDNADRLMSTVSEHDSALNDRSVTESALKCDSRSVTESVLKCEHTPEPTVRARQPKAKPSLAPSLKRSCGRPIQYSSLLHTLGELAAFEHIATFDNRDGFFHSSNATQRLSKYFDTLKYKQQVDTVNMKHEA